MLAESPISAEIDAEPGMLPVTTGYLGVLVLGGGLGLFEGVLMYAAAGAFVWYLAKGTFWSRRSDQTGGQPGE